MFLNFKSKTVRNLFNSFLTAALSTFLVLISKYIFSSINQKLNLFGIFFGVFIGILIIHPILQKINISIFDLLKTTRYTNAYAYGNVVKLHVMKGLKELYSNKFHASFKIFEDALYACHEIITNKMLGQQLFKRFVLIEGKAFFLWKYASRSNSKYNIFDRIIRYLFPEASISETKMNFYNKFSLLTFRGLIFFFSKHNRYLYNKNKMGIFRVDISTADKCNNILRHINPVIIKLNAINSGESNKRKLDVLLGKE